MTRSLGIRLPGALGTWLRAIVTRHGSQGYEIIKKGSKPWACSLFFIMGGIRIERMTLGL